MCYQTITCFMIDRWGLNKSILYAVLHYFCCRNLFETKLLPSPGMESWRKQTKKPTKLSGKLRKNWNVFSLRDFRLIELNISYNERTFFCCGLRIFFHAFYLLHLLHFHLSRQGLLWFGDVPFNKSILTVFLHLYCVKNYNKRMQLPNMMDLLCMMLCLELEIRRFLFDFFDIRGLLLS